MSCQCGNGCNNSTTPTSFSNVDISGANIVGSTFTGGTIDSSTLSGYAVETIDDLKALPVSSITVNVVNVLGYYAAGDGGGGLFWWDPTSALADNGGTVFQSNTSGTGRWLRL